MEFRRRLSRIAISRRPQKQFGGDRTKRFARIDYYLNDAGMSSADQRFPVDRRNTSIQLIEQFRSTAPNDASYASAGRAGNGGYRLIDVTDHN